jgi:hypothetical protein
MQISRFKIYYCHSPLMLGIGTLRDNRTAFKVEESAKDFFEMQQTGWLCEFRKEAARLMKSVGHYSRFSIAENEEYGIRVERM